MMDPTDKIAALLDALGQYEGGILYRAVDRWRVLPPGNLGDVLAIGLDGMPAWFPPGELPAGGSIVPIGEL